MSFLAPKPQKSESGNHAFDQISSLYTPQAQNGVTASNRIAALLGLGGDSEAASAGYDQFKQSAGYQNVLSEAMRGITGNAAARGLLGSGSTLRALQNRSTDLGQQYFTNYLGQLSGLGSLGNQGGQLIANTGQYGQGTGGGPSTLSNIGNAVSTVASVASILSDRRAKTNIVKLEEMDDGLGLYEFRYIGDPELQVGVMADEVERLRPWALGTPVDGFQTVNYEAL